MGAIFTNFAAGTITDSPLTNSAGAINSANFASLPAVAAPDFLFIVLDPAATAGVPEVVKVTAHTLGATTVTVSRGQQTTQGGSAARQHAGGTTWVHALTALDLDAFPYRIVTTKGDIIAGTGPGAVTRVPATADQSFLRTDSSQTSGIKWGNLGTVPVHASSGARDAAMPTPGVGQGVYVKSNDVNEGVYFNTSAGGTPPGIYRPAWNSPWGQVAYATSAAVTTGIVADADVVTVTFNAVQNRRYRINFSYGGKLVTAGGECFAKITDNTPTTLQQSQSTQATNNYFMQSCTIDVTAAATASVTYRGRASTNSGSGSITLQGALGVHVLTIDDVGPAGAPA